MFKRLSHIQLIILGYLAMILTGTALLMLPFSSADGSSVGFQNAFFTATSASCVTGLVRLPTGGAWSPFGQLVLLLLIQIGGLGFMTIATFFFLFFHKRMRLSARETMVESLNLSHINGIQRLAGKILSGTLILEGSGMLLLSLRFIPRYGLGRGLWLSLFHSVSAFCNAGFDLFSGREEAGSLMLFHDDPLVIITISLLIIIGGLGFLVWDDLVRNRLHFKRYSFHTKLVLCGTAILLLGGTLLFFLLEQERGGPLGTRILEAFFASVTPRTAGFNSTDTAALTDASKLLTIFLMLIGGAPGSTAGGIKVTTIIVLFLSLSAGFQGKKRSSAFGRSISPDTVRKSATVLMTNASFALLAALCLCGIDKLPALDALFESFSAIGTVGMSTGVTGSLSPFSAYLIALLMFLGRVGSVSFSVALLEKRQAPVQFPEENVTVG